MSGVPDKDPGKRGQEGMRKIDQLAAGRTVIFTRRPTGSWLSENVPYVVEANGGRTCHFRNPATGGGTYDDAWAIERAEFIVLPAAGRTGQETARGEARATPCSAGRMPALRDAGLLPAGDGRKAAMTKQGIERRGGRKELVTASEIACYIYWK